MPDEQTNDTQPVPDVQGDGQPPEKSFSQAELDKIIAERLKREREKYADYGDLQKAAAKLAEIEEANKSELEKLQERAARADAQRDEALARANERLMRAAFVAEAAGQNVAHPEDAYMLADLSGVEISDDGAVAGVKEAVKALVEAGRLVIKKQPAPSLNGGAGGGQPSGDTVTLSEEQLKVAQQMGLKPEEYAAGIRYKRKE